MLSLPEGMREKPLREGLVLSACVGVRVGVCESFAIFNPPQCIFVFHISLGRAEMNASIQSPCSVPVIADVFLQGIFTPSHTFASVK